MKRSHVLLAVVLLTFVCLVQAQSLESPEEVFGFQMGADRKLINWEQIVSYFERVDAASDRLQVVELGKTTLGRPMIMAIIGSEESMQNLDRYREIQQQLARPFDLEESEAEHLIEEGKLVFIVTLNIHSTEIAASQESVELAYEMATRTDPEMQKILDNVIILMVPSLNPDGQDLITKWYLKDVGTEYEGSRMPMKYHHYADHDNNRDWFFFNLVESRNVAKVLYHAWYPEIVLDQHQMGSSGARLFLPPYADPVNPNVAPELMAAVNMLGKHVVYDMHNQGFTGLVTGTIFNAYFEGTMSKTPLWHNRVGILTEAASVRIATPIFFPKTSLRGMGLDLPEYTQQTNFLNPWPGGWWRLRDIIEYEKAATYSMLDLAATYKEKFKTTFYRLNRKAIEAGKTREPFAYVMAAEQHDPGNAVEMLKRLRIANVDIYRADEDFTTSEGAFRQGDFIVPLAQPARAYVKDLLEVQHYPNLREYPGGPPRRPYDVTAWTLPMQMAVEAVQVDEPFEVAMSPVEPSLDLAEPDVQPGWIAIERRHSHSHKLINELLKSDFEVYALQTASDELPTGTFLVEANRSKLPALTSKADAAEVPLRWLGSTDDRPMRRVESARIAVYQSWIPWAYDEGWLRLVLDNFGFSYEIVHNEVFRNGDDLRDRFDVLVFGSQSSNSILNGREDQSDERIGAPKIRQQYQGGVGKSGVEKIKQFMRDGGTVLFFGEACNFAIDELGLPARNALKNVRRDDFFAPGSIFEMRLDLNAPLTRGMREKAAVYVNNPVALELRPYHAEIREVGKYANRDVLLSGWVVGEDKLYDKVALAEIPVDQGRAILYAFRPQHRGQTYGTFKLIFNALYR